MKFIGWISRIFNTKGEAQKSDINDNDLKSNNPLK
jgi:hypothetical protein